VGRVLLLVALLGALALGGDDPDPGNLNPAPSVLLEEDVTPAERAAVVARLRALPGVVRVETLDQAAEIARLKAGLADQPDIVARLNEVDPETLPERIEFQFRNRAATQRFAASDGPDQLRLIAGVDLVAIPMRKAGESVSECTMSPEQMYGAPEVLVVKVLHSMDASEAEKRAVAERLRATPGATRVDFRTRDQAYAEYLKLREEVPNAPATEPGNLPDGWTLTLRDRAAVYRAVDDKLAEQVCRMPGVAAVVVPPKATN
jgi:cell division protein FtsX